MLRIIILIPLPRERKPNSRKKKSRLHWLRSRLTAGYLLTGLCTTGLDGLGMTWQLHKKTRTKVRVFRAKNYLQKLFTFSTRKWPKNYLLMYDSLINTSALKVRLLNLVNLVQLLRRCCKNKSWVLNLGDVSTLFKYKYYTTTAARRTRWWRWRCSCSWWRWWRAGSPPPKHRTQNPLRPLLPPTAQPAAIAAT